MIFLKGGTRVQCEESLPPIILAKHTSGLQKNCTVVSSFHFLRQIGRVKICLPDKKVFLHSCPAYTFVLSNAKISIIGFVGLVWYGQYVLSDIRKFPLTLLMEVSKL